MDHTINQNNKNSEDLFKVSYSKFSTFFSCGIKYDLHYNKKIKGLEERNTSAELGKLIHKIMENYREGLQLEELYKVNVKNYVITEEDLKLVPKMLKNAEKMYQPYRGLRFVSEDYITVPLFNNEFAIHGYIDKYYIHRDTDKIRITVIDYKTGRSRGRFDNQLKFYFIMLMNKYNLPAEKIQGKIQLLRLDDTISYNFTTGQINEFKTHLRHTVELMKRKKKFSPGISKLCEYCEYREMCSAYLKFKELRNSYNKKHQR